MFCREKNEIDIKRAECALELNRRIVGVRFLFTKEEYEQSQAKGFDAKTPYCSLVKVCMAGVARKADLSNFGCLSAARAFGLVEPTEDWLSGKQYARKGMYRDLGTAKKVVNNTTNIKQSAYGVEIMPLEQFTEEPHIVLIATMPYNIMRLVQGYTYAYGTNASYKLIGNQALCSECTAYPFESNNINISAMCAGTRYMAGWGKDEMAMGMPYHMFSNVVEGVWNTVNAMEQDGDKAVIEKKIKDSGLDDLEIEYHKNYYTGLYLK